MDVTNGQTGAESPQQVARGSLRVDPVRFSPRDPQQVLDTRVERGSVGAEYTTDEGTHGPAQDPADLQ